MDNTLELSFLWHMHQPDYRDKSGTMRMPWVFMHAIKDYYDMPWMLSKFGSLKASFNITPPLIEQLHLYKEPLKNDYFLSLWYKDPSQLTEDERNWLIKLCKSANFEMMVKPNPYYLELYYREKLSDSELIDLEILFMLAWCGPYLRLHSDVIQLLLKKRSKFTTDEKKELFDILIKFVEGILPFYASLQIKGQISISTTPYNHPILPLLIDMENVKRANPKSNPPSNSVSLYDDAREQIRRSVNLYRETFGHEPVGFWPAEGSVDEASVPLYKEFGIKWIATDEQILLKSLALDDDTPKDRTAIYQPYQKDGLAIFFRDHGLSDLFGFEYRYKTPAQAVTHFIASLERIAKSDNKEQKSVFVILDGENAWEYYQSNGYAFFMYLYEELTNLPWCRMIDMDTISKRPNITPLNHLASGSWINGDFNTWSNHPEKNRAWELIFATYHEYTNHKDKLDSSIQEEIRTHFLAAQCSDWFWWYGDDHTTEFALEFDELFRGHLISVYRLMEKDVPIWLFEPIIECGERASFFQPIRNTISPPLRRGSGDFFDWLGAGSVYEDRIFSAMDRRRGPIKKLNFGFDAYNIYIAFYGDIDKLHQATLIITSKTFELSLEINKNGDFHRYGTYSLRVDSHIELSINREVFASEMSPTLLFEFRESDTIIQTLPGYGSLEIDLTKDYTNNWFI